MSQNDNIWEYAKAEVDKPSFSDQIAHSSAVMKMQKLATVSGMFGAVKTLAQASTNAIPLPVIGSFLSAAIENIYAAAKAARLKSRLAGAQGDDEKFIKFAIKQLDAKALDLKRKKVTKAVTKYVAESTGDRYNNYVAWAQGKGGTCLPLVEKAQNIEYALKHIRILGQQADDMVALGGAITEWCGSLEKTMVQAQDKSRTLWDQNLGKTTSDKDQTKRLHGHCMDTGGFCCVYRIKGGTTPMNPNVKMVLNVVTGTITDCGITEAAAAPGITA